ncbi:hypothetical protein LCGC14_1270890 [marine sediment metagenome]|uniref:Uncharacterized protein n=1 Tax=marine sediment metagenome TaxID=412755 RepID=A0A0F9LJ38_9ZZZZ
MKKNRKKVSPLKGIKEGLKDLLEIQKIGQLIKNNKKDDKNGKATD